MDYDSPFALAKDMGTQIARFVSNTDIDSLSPPEREVLVALKHQAADIRLDMRDYGVAESAEAQRLIASEVAARLDQLQVSILRASEYNLLGAADVAQLSAHLQQLKDVLQARSRGV